MSTSKYKYLRERYLNTEIIVPFKGREIDLEKFVYVHRNLNRKGVWYSVLQNNQVVAHAKAVMLSEAEFVVRQAGAVRAKSTGKRNVHAFVKGFLCTTGMFGVAPESRSLHVKVRYVLGEGFETVDFVPQVKNLKSAAAVCLNQAGASCAYLNA